MTAPGNVARVAPGRRVTLHLALSLPDGTEALSTFGEEPLSFVMGDGTLTEGLELSLYGLRAGDREALELDPEQAFGLRDESLIQTLPRSDFPPDMTLEPGYILAFTTPSGDEVAGQVLEVGGQQVELDFNHPLAGRHLHLRAQILSVD
jgi:FKBP-type peptidyl-prolyl cis-trans isomerase SlpA